MTDLTWIQAVLDWFGWWVLMPLFLVILFFGMLWILLGMIEMFFDWFNSRHRR